MVNVVPREIVCPFVGQVICAVKEVCVELTTMTDTDAVPVFPAASCATALIVCEPLA
jgi:hypothetical protein